MSSLSSLRNFLHQKYSTQLKEQSESDETSTELGLTLTVSNKIYFVPLDIFLEIFAFLPTKHLLSKCLPLNSTVYDWITKSSAMQLQWFLRWQTLVSWGDARNTSLHDLEQLRQKFNSNRDWCSFYIEKLRLQHEWWIGKFQIATWKMAKEWVLKPGKFSAHTRQSLDVTRLPYHPSQPDRDQSTRINTTKVHDLCMPPNSAVASFIDEHHQIYLLNLRSMTVTSLSNHAATFTNFAYKVSSSKYVVIILDGGRISVYNVETQALKGIPYEIGEFNPHFGGGNSFYLHNDTFGICISNKVALIDLSKLDEDEDVWLEEYDVLPLDEHLPIRHFLAWTDEYVAWIQDERTIVVCDRQTKVEIQRFAWDLPSQIFYTYQYSRGAPEQNTHLPLQIKFVSRQHIELCCTFIEAHYRPEMRRSAFGVLTFNIHTERELRKKRTFMLDTDNLFAWAGRNALSVFCDGFRFTVSGTNAVLTTNRLRIGQVRYHKIPFPSNTVAVDGQRILCGTDQGIYCMHVRQMNFSETEEQVGGPEESQAQSTRS